MPVGTPLRYLSLPAGEVPGLPIGIRIAARPWREEVALAAAKHLEQELGELSPPPI